MSAPKKKTTDEEKSLPPVDDAQDDNQNDDVQNTHPEETTPAANEPEPPDHVRAFARSVRAHADAPRGQHIEPVRGVTLLYGYNGLLRAYPGGGQRHVHVATHEDLATMSDQQLYDAAMAAGQRKNL